MIIASWSPAASVFGGELNGFFRALIFIVLVMALLVGAQNDELRLRPWHDRRPDRWRARVKVAALMAGFPAKPSCAGPSAATSSLALRAIPIRRAGNRENLFMGGS